MANMRVHELAKELNISSKAITDMLSNADKKYTAMSGLGESEINSVKSKFTKAAGNTANKSGPKKAEEKQVKSEENKNIKAQDKTGISLIKIKNLLNIIISKRTFVIFLEIK